MKETGSELLIKLAAADNLKATIAGQLKKATDEYEAIKDRVLALLDEQGLTGMEAPSAGLKVSISETEQFSFEDYEAFTKFVLRHKAVELFQRRLSPKVVEDMIAARKGLPIPGIRSYTSRRLHVTTSKKGK